MLGQIEKHRLCFFYRGRGGLLPTRAYTGIGKVDTMTMDEWNFERIRLDTQVAQARTDGVGERAAFRLVLLHNRVKPEETQELEEATETYSKKRKTEDHEEQEKEEDKKHPNVPPSETELTSLPHLPAPHWLRTRNVKKQRRKI